MDFSVSPDDNFHLPVRRPIYLAFSALRHSRILRAARVLVTRQNEFSGLNAVMPRGPFSLNNNDSFLQPFIGGGRKAPPSPPPYLVISSYFRTCAESRKSKQERGKKLKRRTRARRNNTLQIDDKITGEREESAPERSFFILRCDNKTRIFTPGSRKPPMVNR